MSIEKKLLLLTITVMLGPLGFIARAQVDLRNAPRFDVASVKPDPDTSFALISKPENGRWMTNAAAIPELFAFAYDVSSKRVEGVPKALQGPTPGFTIEARMPVSTTHKDFLLMVQALLEDRFNAKVHIETRDVPSNSIELAKGGIKLKQASGQCVEVAGNEKVPEGQYRCHQLGVRVVVKQGQVQVQFSGWSISMADLAAYLSANFAGFMVDATGLPGLYDLDVKIDYPNVDDPLEISSERAWAEAWEKQAGLVIDRHKIKKRPGIVVVVDHVELPTPN